LKNKQEMELYLRGTDGIMFGPLGADPEPDDDVSTTALIAFFFILSGLTYLILKLASII
jgi:hypothetical protein